MRGDILEKKTGLKSSSTARLGDIPEFRNLRNQSIFCSEELCFCSVPLFTAVQVKGEMDLSL